MVLERKDVPEEVIAGDLHRISLNEVSPLEVAQKRGVNLWIYRRRAWEHGYKDKWQEALRCRRALLSKENKNRLSLPDWIGFWRLLSSIFWWFVDSIWWFVDLSD